MTARRKTPPSVNFVLRKLDRAIRAHESARRGLLQQAEFTAGSRMSDRIDTLQGLREKLFGTPLRAYTINRPLFPRPRRRKASR